VGSEGIIFTTGGMRELSPLDLELGGGAAVDAKISGEAAKEIREVPVEVLSISEGAGHRLEKSGTGS
jgi:hypothetical protein